VNVVPALESRWSLVALATTAGIAAGAIALAELPSGIYPDVDFPRVVAVARSGDLPPEVMQAVVTRRLEEAMATVPQLVRLRSRTIRGATEIGAQFAAGTDMWRTLQLVEAHVAEVRGELPADTDLRIERITPVTLPIITFNVTGDVDARLLREAAAYTLRPALTRVPGVGAVEVQGGDVRELEVILDAGALAATHLTPSAVADKLAGDARVVGVGRAADEHQVLTVLAASEPATPEQIAALPIGTGPNGPVPLSAVARVVEGAADRTLSVAGPDGDAAVVTVGRAPGASAPDVAAGARAVVADLLAARALPPGVRVETIYDQSLLIDDALRGVRDAILVGVALSLVVLALFLRDARAGAAAAIAVPITLVITFAVVKLAGQTLNVMSLGGLAVAIGLVVDDAIVIVEAIVRRVEEGLAPRAAAARGTEDLFAAVVGTTLTTVVVFAPLALLAGVVGSFFGALAVTLSAAVLLSLAVSVTVVPLVAGRLLRARPRRPGSGLARAYARAAAPVVRRPWISVAVILVVGAVGVVAAREVATGFLPAMDEGAFVLDFFCPPGTSLEETDRIARRLDHILAGVNGVVAFTRRTGAEMGPAAATQQSRGDILVRIAPRRARRAVYEIMDEIRERAAAEVPEARIELIQVLQDILNDLSGSPRPVEIKLFGPDPRALDDLAREVAKRLDGLDELDDFFNGVEGSVPVLRVDVDPAAAARVGVSAGDVSSDLQVLLGGRVSAQVRRGAQLIGVRLHLPDDVRFRPEAIATLPLSYGPLAAVARVTRPVGPAVLVRENLAPVVIATAGLRPGADLGGTVAEVRRRLADLPLQAGYRVEIGGQSESARQTQLDLLGVMGLGVALVLAILILQLRSLRLALVVLLGIPLALVGAVVTLLVTGIALNASALMGCVLLAGLVVKNGILLLERAEDEARSGVPFAVAVARAGERRLRPILMTTLATVAGLLPLALGLGSGAELQRPLAVAVIGGLVLSTLVTLFAVPALAVALVRPRKAPILPG
jgi:multidrug efflux pump subunit AcrB